MVKAKPIKDCDRCLVGLHKNGKFHVWHKVIGPGTRAITVKAEDVASTCKSSYAWAKKNWRK